VKPTRFVPCTASQSGALEPDLGGVALRFSPREFHSSPPHTYRRPMLSLANAFSAQDLTAVSVTGPLDLFHIFEALGIGQ